LILVATLIIGSRRAFEAKYDNGEFLCLHVEHSKVGKLLAGYRSHNTTVRATCHRFTAHFLHRKPTISAFGPMRPHIRARPELSLFHSNHQQPKHVSS
jgi:hypothetical protein